jgi:hypothetical protein
MTGSNDSKPEITPKPAETPGPRKDSSFDLPPPRVSSEESHSTDPRQGVLTPGPFIQQPVREPINLPWFLYQVMMIGMLLAVLGATVWYIQGLFEQPVAIHTGKGRLVVVVVLDHIRGDLLESWRTVGETNGLERLRAEGVNFTDVHLPYAVTDSTTGYASIATGLPPSEHGIISPRKWTTLQNTTLGDELLRVSPKSRVMSFGLKQQAVELLGGTGGTAYFYDANSGRFRTERDATQRAWVERFNTSGTVTRWEQKDWSLLPPLVVAERYANDDKQPGEAKWLGRSEFPYPLGQGTDYLKSMPRTPFGNELVWEFAKTAIDEESLGQDQVDLLWLSFSATELIGETFGPQSHEMFDSTFRLDRLITTIQDTLRLRLGSRYFSLIITSSAGLAPVPERVAKEHNTAMRFKISEEYGPLETSLSTAFGESDEPSTKWLKQPIEESFPWVVWNEERLNQSGVPRTDVFTFARKWLSNRNPTSLVLDRSQLLGEASSERVIRQAQLNFHPDRFADWLIITQPYCVADSGQNGGTRSGSPHSYDTHIPLLAVGPGIPKLGNQGDRLDALIIAPLICKALGIAPPAGVTARLPSGF